MQHYLYRMTGIDTAPAGTGCTRDWFYYYKWNVAGATFVPVKESPAVEAGDMIWFAMDGCLLGSAMIEDVMDDPISGHTEIWYDPESGYEVRPDHAPDISQVEGTHIPESLGRFWFSMVLSKPD